MNTSFYDTQFYRIKCGDAGDDAPPPPHSPVIFEMTKLTPENYISLESQRGINPWRYLPCLHTRRACHVLRSEISLESHFFGSKICNMNFSFLGVKIFSNYCFILDSFL